MLLLGMAMERYRPEALSPVLRPGRPGELPHGLTLADLRPAAPAALDLENVRVFASHDKQGLHGGPSSSIVTLESGTQALTVFIKEITDPQKHESVWYEHLARHGAPTPRLLCAIARGSTEIIVLEFLPRIGIDFAAGDEVAALLRAVAALNAVPPTPALSAAGASTTPPEVFDARVRSALETAAAWPARPHGMDVDRWFAGYRRAQAALAAMPMAVSHGELYFQQVGWVERRARPALVLFDFETLGWRPRLTDIASILRGLTAGTGASERALLGAYLDEVRRRTGTALDVDDAFTELRLVRLVDSCWSLPWRLQLLEEHPDTAGELELALTCMRDDLSALGAT
jgi:hypothetical protein